MNEKGGEPMPSFCTSGIKVGSGRVEWGLHRRGRWRFQSCPLVAAVAPLSSAVVLG